ncbi:MAG: 4-hydroxy-tetrahydrodipicolinate synthase [Candidatus Cloacimonetes bacterium]|nr:4-hydroxy-tetrahydrodipicolinate synthase [Candidatus Cloacimonadota bacterium]
MLKGSYVALVTPFNNGEIDYNAFEILMDFHLQNNTDGVLLCGTTGEAPALASDEKERFIRYGMQKCRGKVPVMMGTGTNNLSTTVSQTIKAQEWGVDYALVVTPYYNKPTQKGLLEYYKAIADRTDIPLVIYNVPGRTGVNINSETVLELAHGSRKIVGIKDAGGNLMQISRIVKEAPSDFAVMSGEDALNLPIMSCGGKGAISVTANIVPQLMHNLIQKCLEGSYSESLHIHLQLLDLNEAMFYETNPIPVKEALHMMNLIKLEFRSPLCPLLERNRKLLKQVLQKYELI